MLNGQNYIYFVTLFVVLISKCSSSSACKGCTDLDELTFDKLVTKFHVTVVKFDIAYPYGDQHEAYARFAHDVHQVDDLLVAVVGIKDYGELDNKNLSKRFDVPDQLPIIKLFLNGDVTKWIDYSHSTEVKTEDLKQFVRKYSGIYIGLTGCIQEFDEIANDFVRNYTPEGYQSAVARANQLIDGYDNEKVFLSHTNRKILPLMNLLQQKSTGKVYVILMKRIFETGLEYVEEEKQRTMEMLGKKINKVKQQEMMDRLNILKAFDTHAKIIKTEL